MTPGARVLTGSLRASASSTRRGSMRSSGTWRSASRIVMGTTTTASATTSGAAGDGRPLESVTTTVLMLRCLLNRPSDPPPLGRYPHDRRGALHDCRAGGEDGHPGHHHPPLPQRRAAAAARAGG